MLRIISDASSVMFVSVGAVNGWSRQTDRDLNFICCNINLEKQ